MKTIRLLLALSVIACSSLSQAQTSGSLSTQANTPWTTAPWTITGGPGAFPDGGGVATFLDPINTVIGVFPSLPNITLDVPITLSSIVFNSIYQYAIIGTAANNLTLTGSGTINVNVSPQNFPTFSTVTFGPIITAPIAGSVGLNFQGNNTTLTLQGVSTYTGGTTINNGRLIITAGDATLGATGAGNDLTINNGQLLVATTALTTARNINITGNVRIEPFNAAATLNGIISGSGNFIRIGNSALTLNGANTFTGTTSNLTGTMTIGGGNGTIASSSGYDFAGTVALDNATANNNNRLSDTGAITARGGALTMTGNAAAATSETAGALNLTSGNTTVTVTPNAAQQASLNFAAINRLNRSTAFVRGTNLGAAAANGVAQITAGNTLSTIGGGGAAGSTNISVIPWGVGNIGAAATVASTHLTQSGSGALRPLATSEYAIDFTGSPDNNVRLSAATAAPSGATANALLFAPAAAATLSGGPINITSGSFLYSPSTGTGAGTVSAGLNFGAAEGFLHTSTTLSVSGVISGTNGLTVNPFAGSVVTLTGANTYTGATTVNAGQLTFSGVIDPSTAGPLGQTNAPIILNAGSATTRIWVNGDSTFNRDIVVMGPPNAATVTAGLGATATFNITVNGNVDLQRRLTLENGSTLPMTFNGVISGAGSLTDAFSTLTVLNGANTYSGGTEITTGTYQAGTDTAFGSGLIYFIGAGGTIRGSGVAPRTISNNVQVNSTFSATAASNPTFGGTAPLNFTGAIDLNGVTRGLNVTNTAPTVFTGEVKNGAFQKFGTGTLSLNRASGNTYTGGTVLGATAGILNVNNTTGSGTGSGTVSIGGTTAANRSTLSGNFSISGATSISGTLSPGNSVGTANFGSSLTLAINSNTVIEIASAASFDKLNVAGLLSLPGSATTSTFSISTIGGYDAPIGTSFDIVDWGTLAANGFNPATQITFTNQPGSAGTTLDTSNFLTNGRVVVAAVPEPSTWMMMGVGASALVAMMRLRRRSS